MDSPTRSEQTEDVQKLEKTESSTAAPVRTWKSGGRILGMPVSLIAIWAALFVAASAVPALPVPGMGGMITVNALMTSISGMILGPAAIVGGMAGAIIATILFPFGAFFGPLSFITTTVGSAVAGLTFTNHWKLAGLLELLVIGSWFANPQSWQPWMWMVPLPYTVVALLVIFVKPLREWARRMIFTMNKKWMWLAVALMCTCGHSPEYMTSNSMQNWLFTLRWQYWIPTLPYWIGVDTVIIALSTVVGMGVIVGLRRARLPNAVDQYAPK